MDTMFASTLALLLCATVAPQISATPTTVAPQLSATPTTNLGPNVTELRNIIQNTIQNSDVCQSNAPIHLCGTGTYRHHVRSQ